MHIICIMRERKKGNERKKEQHSLPQDWLIARAVPIHKSSDKHKVENYRPISITCTCCKILEHILSESLFEYFESFNMLSPSQHGFRKRLENGDPTHRNNSQSGWGNRWTIPNRRHMSRPIKKLSSTSHTRNSWQNYSTMALITTCWSGLKPMSLIESNLSNSKEQDQKYYL